MTTAEAAAVERDWLRIPHRRPSVQAIFEAVARYHEVTPAEITGPRRHAEIVWPRHLAMWLCRHLRPDQSWWQLARAFNRDHATVIYGCRQAARRLGGRTARSVWLELHAEQGSHGPHSNDQA